MNNENGGIAASSKQERNPRSAGDEPQGALVAGVVAGAKQVTEGVKEAGAGAASQVKDAAAKRITGGKDRAAESLGTVAAALRETGQRLQDEEAGGVNDYVVKAADRLEQVSGYLKQRDLGAVLRDVGDFARREPALFLGGAFVLGLAGGRFLKSSHRAADGDKVPGAV